MICANPECSNEVPHNPSRDVKYCCVKCRNRANRILDTARRREKRGEPEPREFRPRGKGIPPLNTSRIKKARKHEQEMIDLVVKKAKDKPANGNTLTIRKITPNNKGVRVG